jgi:hypothetical protein
MSLVEKKFKEAVHFFHELEKNSFDQLIYEANLSAFINATRNISYAIQKEGKPKKNFAKWWNEKREQMREDELMKFFYELRNYSIKEGTNKVSQQSGLQMRHTLNFDGKGGCIATLKSRDGQTIGEKKIISDPNAKFFLGGIGISLDSGLWEKMYFFDEIENANLQNRSIINITDLCFDYLNKLYIIVNEYFKKIYKE